MLAEAATATSTHSDVIACLKQASGRIACANDSVAR